MSTQHPRKRLPVKASIEHLRKQAKRRAAADPSLKLADAQHRLAREYGFGNWAELVRSVETSRKSQRASTLDDAVRSKDIDLARRLLENGADPNQRGEGGATALHRAATLGPMEMIELLQSHGALAWIGDDSNRKPIDYARSSDKLEPATRDRIIELLGGPRIDDPNFRNAVAAIDRGDLDALRELLRMHPYLATVHTNDPGSFAGPYFARPALLWFVAENPIRNGKLPANICQIAEAIIDAGASRDDIDYTLLLVCSGSVARECKMQVPLIEMLVRRGADPSDALAAAVQEREQGAIDALLRLGAKRDLAAAAGIGDLDSLRNHLRASSLPDHMALLRAWYNAAINGQIQAIDMLVDRGKVDINVRIGQGTTALHQAAWHNDRALAQRLLERGADPTIRDGLYNGTPAGWAEHAGHTELAAFLRERAAEWDKNHSDA